MTCKALISVVKRKRASKISWVSKAVMVLSGFVNYICTSFGLLHS